MIDREDTVNSYILSLNYVDGLDKRLWEIRNPKFEKKEEKKSIISDGIGEYNIRICYL